MNEFDFDVKASIDYDEDHVPDGYSVLEIFREQWSLNRIIHRIHGPAISKLQIARSNEREDIIASEEEWYFFGKKHRLFGPAEIYSNQHEVEEAWYNNGKLHRKDGPAQTTRLTSNGVLVIEKWYVNGRKHRVDGPALIYRADDGQVTEERWYLNGQLHREGGPAVTEIDEETGEILETYYLHGRKIKPFGDSRLPQPGP